MSKKKYQVPKYLLTAWEIRHFPGFPYTHTREWFEAHEYQERTCRMVDNGAELCCSECDRRHDYDDEPRFCMGCGAKVVSE